MSDDTKEVGHKWYEMKDWCIFKAWGFRGKRAVTIQELSFSVSIFAFDHVIFSSEYFMKAEAIVCMSKIRTLYIHTVHACLVLQWSSTRAFLDIQNKLTPSQSALERRISLFRKTLKHGLNPQLVLSSLTILPVAH
jgi:hypothetical protein